MKPITLALILLSCTLAAPWAFAQAAAPGEDAAGPIADAEEVEADMAGSPPDLVLTPAELQAIGRAKPTASGRPDLGRGFVPPEGGHAQDVNPSSPQPPHIAGQQDQDRSFLSADDGPVRISILDTLMKLGVVVVLLYGCLYLYRGFSRRGRPAGGLDGTTLCIVQTMSMGGSKALHVVEAGPRTLLIGDSGSRLAILADLTPDTERRAAVAPARSHAVATSEPPDADALEWEEEQPVRQQRPREPALVTASDERSRTNARQRAAARRTPDDLDTGSSDATRGEPNRSVQGRRALLLRALRSKEDARREPAIAKSDDF